jgi:ABC-type multidrug transport system ATPase subunit
VELIVNTLSKQYHGNVWGLNDFSLKKAPGILGLLGPNGAGKSTLMSILATITCPTEGSVFWNGADIIHKSDGSTDARERINDEPDPFHLPFQAFIL